MPTLVSIDVSVTDNRIRLAFSDRAVAAAYAAYLHAQDQRPPQHQPIPGYRRAAQLHNTTKEVSLSLPPFITWFITCRLPDDEDSVTFTFIDAHEAYASRWAETMLLFEPVAVVSPSSRPRSSMSPSSPSSPRHYNNNNNYPPHLYRVDRDRDDAGGGGGGGGAFAGPVVAAAAAKQLYVRRLWNRAHLLKRLEELRRLAAVVLMPAPTPPPLPMSPPGIARGRMGTPAVWGNGVGNGVNGVNGVVNGVNMSGVNVNGVKMNGARMPLALAGPGAMHRGNIWW